MRISDWSSDVCSSDLNARPAVGGGRAVHARAHAGLLQPAVPPPVRDAQRMARRQARVRSRAGADARGEPRSEEHTSEPQSLMRTSYAVSCLKKKTSVPYITWLTTATQHANPCTPITTSYLVI